MIVFSIVSDFQVLLPVGDGWKMIISIGDKLYCITEWNISSVVVQPDWEEFPNLQDLNSNLFVRLLAGGNENTVAQIIILLSQELNRRNLENLNEVISSKKKRMNFILYHLLCLDNVPAINIFVSPLGSSRLQKIEFFTSHDYLSVTNRNISYSINHRLINTIIN